MAWLQPRIVGLASRHGALVAREAKGLRPSAWAWHERRGESRVYGAELIARAIFVATPSP